MKPAISPLTVPESETVPAAGKPFPWVVRLFARFSFGMILLFLFCLWLWTSGAIYCLPWGYPWLRMILTGVYLLGTPWILYRSEKPWMLLRLPLTVSLLVLVLQNLIRPSNDRDWSADQLLLPRAEIRDQQVVIENVRNFSYQDVDHFQPNYAQRTFDVTNIDSVWFGVEEFSALRALAHTFLTFGFRDGESFDYISVSVEIRREKGEQFTPIGAMFKQFELMYVLGEERDLLGLRTIHRRDVVYLYPMRANRQQMQELFLDVIARTNQVAKNPEFYHTLTSNCTNNLVYHLNRLAPGTVNPLRLGIVFPGYSDRLAFELGLIDTEQSFAETKRRFRVDHLARKLANETNFSHQLRQRLKQQ